MADQQRKSNKSKYFLIIGIILAFATSVLIVAGYRHYNQLVPVVYSVNEIPPFTVIQDSDLIVKLKPRISIEKGMYSKKEPLIGKATRALIVANSTISSDAIAKADGTKPLLSAKVTELKNNKLGAFTVPADGIAACGGDISPGNLVHVIGALNLPAGPSKTAKEPVAKILAPYARVIQVLGKGSQTAGVTLAVTPQQAQDIQLALLNGRVSFMVLPDNPDMKAGITETTTVDSFIKKYILPTKDATASAQQEEQNIQSNQGGQGTQTSSQNTQNNKASQESKLTIGELERLTEPE